MENNITLKIKYIPETGDYTDILNILKNYNSILHFTYNRILDGYLSTKSLTFEQHKMNNTILDSHFLNSAIYDAKGIAELNKDKKVIFGGKKLFLDRCKNKISNEEFKIKKLRPISSIGESNQKANRKFKILDNSHIVFQPNKTNHILLNLQTSRNYSKILDKLYNLQEAKQIAITYKLDLEHVYLTFDYNKIKENKYKTIKNRVLGIDLNPNYIGYSIVDWNNETSYKIINSGVFELNRLNSQNTDKKDFEIIQIAHELSKLAKHFKCEVFAIEDLAIKTKDLHKGRKLNKLVNNDWNRNRLRTTIKKLISCSSTTFLEVKPNYSSILGNLIYRDEKLPDMVLSSIEIGRRGIEFQNQYLLNIKLKKKNIVFPDFELVENKINQSLEELKDFIQVKNYKELFSELKKSKLKYRFLLSSVDESRVFSKFYSKSKIKLYNFI